MRQSLNAILHWLKSLGLIGRCYLCNKPMKLLSRGGYAYVDYRDKRMYRTLLCKEHYEGYFNFAAVKNAVHAKVAKQLRAETKAKTMTNPK